MGQLLEIFGRGLEVEVTDLIWHWLGQAAETVAGCDAAQARMLNEIIELSSAKKPTLLQHRLAEYRRAYPRCHCADLAAAAVAISDNRLTDAFDLLSCVYSRCPRNVTALYALGHCCERLDRQNDALAYYQDCLKFKNYLKFPRQRLAAMYFKNGQIEKTIHEYQQLAAEFPDDLSTLLTLACLYNAVSEYKCAADTFSTAILIQPDNFCPDTDPIDSLIEAGNLSDALDCIECSLEQHPDRPDLLLRRASVLAELDQQEQALAHYSHTVAVCPDFLEANIKLGTHYLRIGRPASAAHQYIRAAHVNDRIVGAYLGLATAQKLAGNTPEALTSLSLASAVESNGPLLLSESARLMFHNPADDDSNIRPQTIGCILNAHSRLLNIHPQNPELHYRLGTLLMSVGRLHQAAELFTRALELNPTFTLARNKLVVCLYETDEKALALENLTPPDFLNPDMLQLYYSVAILYCDKIKFASSLLNLEEWLNESLACTDTMVNISIVLQNLGLLDPAAETWGNYAGSAVSPQKPANR